MTDDINSQLQTIAKKIKDKFNPQKIILFGSHAYGMPKKWSDVDILVVMETDKPVKEQAFLIRRELRTPIPVDILVRTPQQIKERIELGDFFIKRLMEKGIPL